MKTRNIVRCPVADMLLHIRDIRARHVPLDTR